MAASEAQVLFLPLSSLVVTPHATLNLPSWNSIKSPWVGSHWPAWSCVHLGANHVVAQRWGSADWLGLWGTPLLCGWQAHGGTCWPAPEVGAPAVLGDPQVRVLGPQRGRPGFGDQDVPTGTYLNEWTVLSSDPSCVSASCLDAGGWHHTHPPSLSGMSTPGSSPQHRPAGVSPLSLSTEARRQQAQQVSPTLSPLSPITQVRGPSGAGEVGPTASLGGLMLFPGGRTLNIFLTFFLFFCGQIFKDMGNAEIKWPGVPCVHLS